MKDIRKIWESFKVKLYKLAIGISGREIKIVDIPPAEKELGYTSQGNTIHLANDHEIIKDLDFEHKLIFIKGIFAHELMHQLNTNFKAFEKKANSIAKFEREIYCEIFNIMEDPAIEYWASSFFGGHLLTSLQYAVDYLYRQSPPIEKYSDPFVQFMNAFVQYGDGGMLIGDFTSNEAKEYFYKALPYFDKAIQEPNSAKRVEYAYEVFCLTKPLWINAAKEAKEFQRLLDNIKRFMKEAGKGKEASSEAPVFPIAPKKNSLNSNDKKKKELQEKTKNKDASNMSSEMPPAYVLSSDEIKNIKAEIEECAKESEKKSKEMTNDTQIEDYSAELKSKYGSVKCNNIVVTAQHNYEEEYQKILIPMKNEINTLTKQLKRIFRRDQENKEYRANGKVNIKRLSNSRMTARVFEKRIVPADNSDIAIELVVDNSGSMGGVRIETARKAIIALSEVFGNLNIPIKVLAFTADCMGYDVIHYHYINWKNNMYERMKLLQLSSYSRNFDGYSIRYATKELSKRNEKHKIMIVISDGKPSSTYYVNRESGITDTSNAIREANKKVTVIGVAIGSDVNTLYKMYGEHFIHIKNINELFNKLGQIIRKEIMSW